MDTQPGSAAGGVPPVVLFVDDDRDTLDMYSTYFEMSGMWVAKTRTPADALRSIAELRPDLIVTDLGFEGRESGVAFVHALKTAQDTRDIPLILLSGRSAEHVPAATAREADLCLVKPVLPDALLMDVQRLIALSHTLRDRCARARETAQLGETAQLEVHVERNRPCPQCSQPLEWIEEGEITGVQYDYYRWCRQGCGLYCYDRPAARWVKLV